MILKRNKAIIEEDGEKGEAVSSPTRAASSPQWNAGYCSKQTKSEKRETKSVQQLSQCNSFHESVTVNNNSLLLSFTKDRADKRKISGLHTRLEGTIFFLFFLTSVRTVDIIHTQARCFSSCVSTARRCQIELETESLSYFFKTLTRTLAPTAAVA